LKKVLHSPKNKEPTKVQREMEPGVEEVKHQGLLGWEIDMVVSKQGKSLYYFNTFCQKAKEY
jgi:uncharacterized protein YcnI